MNALKASLTLLVIGAALSIAGVTDSIVVAGVWLLLLSPLVSLIALATDLAKGQVFLLFNLVNSSASPSQHSVSPIWNIASNFVNFK